MPEQRIVHATTEPVSGYQLHRIAGPETARLLGVPEGSIVESRDLSMVPTASPPDQREEA